MLTLVLQLNRQIFIYKHNLKKKKTQFETIHHPLFTKNNIICSDIQSYQCKASILLANSSPSAGEEEVATCRRFLIFFPELPVVWFKWHYGYLKPCKDVYERTLVLFQITYSGRPKVTLAQRVSDTLMPWLFAVACNLCLLLWVAVVLET